MAGLVWEGGAFFSLSSGEKKKEIDWVNERTGNGREKYKERKKERKKLEFFFGHLFS